MITEPYKLIRRCEVTAILILYGLPRYFFSYLHLIHFYYCKSIVHETCLRILCMTKGFYTYRLLTGSILAHEMMHAWLRLKGVCLTSYHAPIDNVCILDILKGCLTGYHNLRPEVEEGICQVLAHMWLESEILSPSAIDVALPSSSSAPPASSSSTSSKKGKRSDFEKKLGAFFKHQIESDTSPAYGDGFRTGNEAVLKYGLRATLEHIRLTGSFPV